MSEIIERDRKNDEIHITEFRRKYFKNGRYVGAIKTSGFASAPKEGQVQL